MNANSGTLFVFCPVALRDCLNVDDPAIFSLNAGDFPECTGHNDGFFMVFPGEHSRGLVVKLKFPGGPIECDCGSRSLAADRYNSVS